MTALGLVLWLPQLGNLPLTSCKENYPSMPVAARSYNVFRALSVPFILTKTGFGHLPDARCSVLGPQRRGPPCFCLLGAHRPEETEESSAAVQSEKCHDGGNPQGAEAAKRGQTPLSLGRQGRLSGRGHPDPIIPVR